MIKSISILFFVVNLTSCFQKEKPEEIAIKFKTLQYINFSKTYDLLHPESNKSLYKKYDTKKDLSKFSKYKENFKFKLISIKDKNDIKVITLEITKPDVTKIFRPMMNAPKSKELKSFLDKNNLPSMKIKSIVYLKKHQGYWKVLFPKPK